MRYALSGCYSSKEDTGMYHDDEKGVYILSDGSRGGKRGMLAQAAVVEAFQLLTDLPESFSREDFKNAVYEASINAERIIDRKIREHVRAGELNGLVQETREHLKQGEIVSHAEHVRAHAVAVEHIIDNEIEHTAATALVAVVSQDKLYIANVAGDSRFEVLTRSDEGDYELETITLDHTFLWLRMHGKMPPGSLEKEKAYELQRELDQARAEHELGDHEVLHEAWKMKEMKGQMLAVGADLEPDFYEIELKDVISWHMYSHGTIEHTARNRRKKELIDAEKIGIPPVTVAKTIVELADECEDCTMEMIYARKIAL